MLHSNSAIYFGVIPTYQPTSMVGNELIVLLPFKYMQVILLNTDSYSL